MGRHTLKAPMMVSYRRIATHRGMLALVVLLIALNFLSVRYFLEISADGGGSDVWSPRALMEKSSGASLNTIGKGVTVTANRSFIDTKISHDDDTSLENDDDTSLKEQANNHSDTSARKEMGGFSACLMFMDDNHFLPEWLAYHYQFLPLRRLIVAIDPKSRTTPYRILDRFHSAGLINVTIWHEEDYFHNLDSITTYCKKMYFDDQGKVTYCVFQRRQRVFYASCMNELIREGRSWTALVDTDEVVVVNKYADPKYVLPNVHPTMMEILGDQTNWKGSRAMSNHDCIAMSRIQFGTREMDVPDNATMEVQEQLDSEGATNISVARDLYTYRWRYHQDRYSINIREHEKLLLGKSVVDVSQLDGSNITFSNTYVHRPSKKCDRNGQALRKRVSAFVVHTYVGTFEQYVYRDDSRNRRNQSTFEQLAFRHGPDEDHLFLQWLPNLISQLGAKTVRYLLHGAGQLDPIRKPKEILIHPMANVTA